ncbi:MAG: Transcription elongation factor GreA [Microgenomates group bacterium GW2011_GWA2_44_7]|nr:MAG: Transcription elongation factor GreA [Microgenomates group bacterium GW2011_GWA2_44_7]
MYYFLKEDFDALNLEIVKIADKIKEIGKEMGKSCQEGAETFHDNFAHEDGERQQRMWSERIRELIRIRNQARIIEPQKHNTVSIGQIVTMEDERTGEMRIIKIGSYMTFVKEDNAVSYIAPLSRMLIGGKAGEIKEAVIAGKKKSFRIIKIEWPSE